MTAGKAYCSKAVVECCYRVLDQLPERLDGGSYREIVETTASSMGLQYIKHIIYWVLEDSGSVDYWRSDRLIEGISGYEDLLYLFDGRVYQCPTANRTMIVLTEARKCKYPTEDEIGLQTEKHRVRIEAALMQQLALRLHKEGKRGPAIARELGLPSSTVHSWLKNGNPQYTWESEPISYDEWKKEYQAMFPSKKFEGRH